MKILELSLYRPVEKKFGKNYNLYYEIKLYHRKIDLYLIPKRLNFANIAMEFKIRDWRKALIQSLSYKLVAEYVYIVIYYKNIDQVDKELLKKYGIGLISASSSSCNIRIKPQKHTIINENLCKGLSEKLNNG